MLAAAAVVWAGAAVAQSGGFTIKPQDWQDPRPGDIGTINADGTITFRHPDPKPGGTVNNMICSHDCLPVGTAEAGISSRCPVLTWAPPAHRYTVAEIDRMRQVVGKSAGEMSATGAVTLGQFALIVETRLATYIAVGITADDLEGKH